LLSHAFPPQILDEAIAIHVHYLSSPLYYSQTFSYYKS
jgi:hypothetical protein